MRKCTVRFCLHHFAKPDIIAPDRNGRDRCWMSWLRNGFAVRSFQALPHDMAETLNRYDYILHASYTPAGLILHIVQDGTHFVEQYIYISAQNFLVDSIASKHRWKARRTWSTAPHQYLVNFALSDDKPEPLYPFTQSFEIFPCNVALRKSDDHRVRVPGHPLLLFTFYAVLRSAQCSTCR